MIYLFQNPFFSIKSKYLEKILLQEGYYKFEENEMNEIQYVNERITKGNTYVNTKDIITSFNSNEKKDQNIYCSKMKYNEGKNNINENTNENVNSCNSFVNMKNIGDEKKRNA